MFRSLTVLPPPPLQTNVSHSKHVKKKRIHFPLMIQHAKKAIKHMKFPELLLPLTCGLTPISPNIFFFSPNENSGINYKRQMFYFVEQKPTMSVAEMSRQRR